MSRWARFLIFLIIGIGIGLLYGWIIDPVEYVDTFPEVLREDYKTDYVLMVAEAFQENRDIDLAAARLAFLGFTDQKNLVENAMYFGVQNGYASEDLGLLRILGDALGVNWNIEGDVTP